ncbi:MAG: Threonine-tRNA ligase [Candidatus Amesbacteria bacterium GW2011_GWB1_47_19]|nr:MAG: Threonine-tRNA ligase [Candidatus Amesbacteria bacterium GW2011_GWA1_44_24]KKU31108.1 MAG: Threonine-tRNA ligase [Candidatus Amesbacteria bacterium GW2011_GWC1_46_24]KKU67229.1 MAG: Threonine-tRNA ligase [Candidatus Amesbacteria bacterium GW2011_GWB1_47_19]OGD05788.1 MAG: threonine--tRNA ligase [Candidatus Amesbacteria bacterium RIFOXYB1_FULL_47_13]HBC72645.1 threonine--tRNA ligase [Candidatus Amesbacteria bacterium]
MNDERLTNLRHSCAHLMAAAVMELWPHARRTIGPSIENGFYFDFDFGDSKITDGDLPHIEAKMHEILPGWKNFERHELDTDAAKKKYPGNVYKYELIDEFAAEGQKLTFYKSGQYWDLCRGGHVEHPDRELKHFKLLSLAGAYWRGNEKNKMLTRIYGTVFPTKKELEDHLNMLEEAKKRDHRKIGPALELFMFHQTSPGMPYWLPNGLIIYNELVKFWREDHVKRGYKEIASPLINKKELYVTSGHFEHYWENMFISKTADEGEYGIKAMNCPNAHVVFGSKTRSYRDLPLRLSDTDTLHRYELSGTLNGLLRVREFRQDDAHIYVTEDQIVSEYLEVFEIIKRFYSIFNIPYSFRLGTRNPDNFMGEISTWDKAEASLKEILEKSGVEYFVLEGDGAFYGPKVDILMKDVLGREWQMGTVQLDFQQPLRFKLEYIDKDGQGKTPICIHRVVYGSLERFIGILIEHFAGVFPVWLSPVQVVVLPISDKHSGYAKKVQEQLMGKGIRSELDSRNEPLNARIRDAQLQKIPYMLVVGDNEIKNSTVSERGRSGKNYGEIKTNKFIADIKEEIASRSLS